MHWLRISLGSESAVSAISHKDSALVSQMVRTQYQFSQLPYLSALKKEVLDEKMMKWFAPEGPPPEMVR
jgi:hypothetical protein